MSERAGPTSVRPFPSPSPRSQSPYHDRYTRIATDRFTPPSPSPSALPLFGEREDPIEMTLSYPRELVSEGEIELAKRAYQQLLAHEKEQEGRVHPLLYVLCKAELAALYPEESKERKAFAILALPQWISLYRIYGDELLNNYRHLKRCHLTLLDLFPERNDTLCDQFQVYTDHCRLWENFTGLITSAEDTDDTNEATQNYREAISLIEDQTVPFYVLHRADCFMKLAQLHRGEDVESDWTSAAKSLIFRVFDQEGADLHLLLQSLEQLAELYDERSPDLEEIQIKLQPLREKLALEETSQFEIGRHVHVNHPEEESEHSSQESRGYNLTYLFMTIVAAALIGAAVMLYRRNVVKL